MNNLQVLFNNSKKAYEEMSNSLNSLFLKCSKHLKTKNSEYFKESILDDCLESKTYNQFLNKLNKKFK